MKKILVLFNGISAPWHITTFALNMAKSNNAGLHVLFLKDEVSDYPYPSDIASVQKSYSAKTEKEDNKKLEEKNIALFKTFCDDKKVACQFERDVSLKNLVNFSPGADIIIMDSYDNFQRYSLKDLLARMKCPVCLVSSNATEIKTNILLYDGSDNSIHAMETYGNLFPGLCGKKSFVLTINGGKVNKPLSQSLLQKFTNIRTLTLSGNSEIELIEFLNQHKKGTMVITGEYGRSAISRLFKPGLSDVIISQTTTSIFITHN